MYKSISIKNYRCFDAFTIKNLARVNLFSGRNNIGKTSLLEAVWLFRGYYNPELGLRVDAFRGIDSMPFDELMLNLFRNFTRDQEIQISCEDDEGDKTLIITASTGMPKSVELFNESQHSWIDSEATVEKSSQEDISGVRFQLSDHRSESIFKKTIYVEDKKIKISGDDAASKKQCVFLTSNRIENQRTLSERFSVLSANKRQKEAIEILRIIEPRLNNLEIQIKGGSPTIHGDIGKSKTYPLPVMGNGLSRLLSIALSISHAAGGVILIDEIENGFHWSVMEKVWQAISNYANQNDVQIFATTHGWECVKAFQKALNREKSISAKMFRLDYSNGNFKTIQYEIDELGLAVEQEIEVR